jgi:hypothetical protein
MIMQSVESTSDRRLPTPDDFDFTIYPNPGNSHVEIRILTSTSAAIHLTVFDLLGCHVSDLADGMIHPGTHTYNLDVSSFPAGVYFVTGTRSGAPRVHKLLVLK